MEKRIHDFLPNVKDYYSINELGEIYSDNSGQMKTRNKPGTEYQLINFQTTTGKKTYSVHRLVLMAFAPVEGMELLEVNHIDGNKRNNNLNNLEWCTNSENQLHAFRLGLQQPRRGEESNLAKLTEKEIKEIFDLRKRGWLQREIAEKFNCTPSNISCILRGKSWKV